MRTSSKMGLRIWNLLGDNYDHEQLADNWAKVDAHDHTPGRGVLIPTQGIAEGAITSALLASDVLERILSATLSYEEAKVLAASTPVTPSTTRLSFVIASFAPKSEEAKVQWEISVDGKAIALPQVSKSTDAQQVVIPFFVPKNKSWQWKTISGSISSATYTNLVF